MTVLALSRAFRLHISFNWLSILIEVRLNFLVLLFFGFAIDGLLANDTDALFQLITILAVLIVVSVIRRAYYTRVFGTVCVEMGKNPSCPRDEPTCIDVECPDGDGT